MRSTKGIVIGALFIAIVTTFTYINVPYSPNGGLIHLGYIALFPIAAIFGKKYGMVAGAIGMALFDVLSQWFLWAPATFIIVGIIGYVVGSISDGGKSITRNIVAMLIASVIQVTGYFLFNAYIAGFGVESAMTSIVGDSIKMLISTAVSVATIEVLLRSGVKNLLSER